MFRTKKKISSIEKTKKLEKEKVRYEKAMKDYKFQCLNKVKAFNNLTLSMSNNPELITLYDYIRFIQTIEFCFVKNLKKRTILFYYLKKNFLPLLVKSAAIIVPTSLFKTSELIEAGIEQIDKYIDDDFDNEENSMNLLNKTEINGGSQILDKINNDELLNYEETMNMTGGSSTVETSLLILREGLYIGLRVVKIIEKYNFIPFIGMGTGILTLLYQSYIKFNKKNESFKIHRKDLIKKIDEYLPQLKKFYPTRRYKTTILQSLYDVYSKYTGDVIYILNNNIMNSKSSKVIPIDIKICIILKLITENKDDEKLKTYKDKIITLLNENINNVNLSSIGLSSLNINGKFKYKDIYEFTIGTELLFDKIIYDIINDSIFIYIYQFLLLTFLLRKNNPKIGINGTKEYFFQNINPTGNTPKSFIPSNNNYKLKSENEKSLLDLIDYDLIIENYNKLYVITTDTKLDNYTSDTVNRNIVKIYDDELNVNEMDNTNENTNSENNNNVNNENNKYKDSSNFNPEEFKDDNIRNSTLVNMPINFYNVLYYNLYLNKEETLFLYKINKLKNNYYKIKKLGKKGIDLIFTYLNLKREYKRIKQVNKSSIFKDLTGHTYPTLNNVHKFEEKIYEDLNKNLDNEIKSFAIDNLGEFKQYFNKNNNSINIKFKNQLYVLLSYISYEYNQSQKEELIAQLLVDNDENNSTENKFKKLSTLKINTDDQIDLIKSLNYSSSIIYRNITNKILINIKLIENKNNYSDYNRFIYTLNQYFYKYNVDLLVREVFNDEPKLISNNKEKELQNKDILSILNIKYGKQSSDNLLVKRNSKLEIDKQTTPVNQSKKKQSISNIVKTIKTKKTNFKTKLPIKTLTKKIGSQTLNANTMTVDKNTVKNTSSTINPNTFNLKQDTSVISV